MAMKPECQDALVTLELCRVFSMREKRSVSQSLRACARVLVMKYQAEQLRATLHEMSRSQFPEVQINQVRRMLDAAD